MRLSNPPPSNQLRIVDLSALTRKGQDLARQLFQINWEANHHHTSWKEASFSSELKNPDTLYLGLEVDGILCGFVGSMKVLDEASINNISVHPALQRKGYGEKLLREMIVRLDALGVRTLFLEVRASNQRARELYQKLGFRQIAVREKYYVEPVEDALILQLDFHEK